MTHKRLFNIQVLLLQRHLLVGSWQDVWRKIYMILIMGKTLYRTLANISDLKHVAM